MRHNAKAKYLEVAGAMSAADRYELKYGFKMRWYLCDECSYYHITTVRRFGRQVVSLDAIQREAKDS